MYSFSIGHDAIIKLTYLIIKGQYSATNPAQMLSDEVPCTEVGGHADFRKFSPAKRQKDGVLSWYSFADRLQMRGLITPNPVNFTLVVL